MARQTFQNINFKPERDALVSALENIELEVE